MRSTKREESQSLVQQQSRKGSSNSQQGGGGGAPVSNGNSVYPPFYQKDPSLPPFVREGDIDYPFEEIDGAGDENKIRGNWSAKSEFLLSAVGYCVGLISNLWRFPYYCHVNGGAIFLIPYAISLFLIGLPLLLLEMSLGQFASLGCVSIWKVCPVFKGVGVGMMIVSCVVAVYYNMISGWAIYYLVLSVRTAVPWATCDHQWNTDQCMIWTRNKTDECSNSNGTLLSNGTCAPIPDSSNLLLVTTLNEDSRNHNQEAAAGVGAAASYAAAAAASTSFDPNKTFPSLEFFQLAPIIPYIPLHLVFGKEVLMLSDGLEDIGNIHWQLALYLLVAWAAVFFCLFTGIKTGGKAVYALTVVPYVILLVLLVRALTYAGSWTGIKQFWSPDWRKLMDYKIWGDAVTQAFFSLGIGWGALCTMASYNKFNNNIQMDIWIIVIADFLSSVFAATVTYATLGYLGHEMDKDVSDLVYKDPRISFVIYAEAIARLPVAPLWAVLFFLMILLVIIDTEMYIVETVVTGVCDEYAERLRKNHRHVLSLFAFLFYVAGVALSTQAGLYCLQLLDYFLTSWTVILIVFFEVMAVAWVYGIDNFLDNVKWMILYYPQPYIYWKLVYKFLLPLILLVMAVYCWIDYKPLEYMNKPFPEWANLAGWLISFVPVLAIPATAIFQLCRSKGPCSSRLQLVMSPDDDWGPALAIHRAQHYPLQIPEARSPLKVHLTDNPIGSFLTDGNHTAAAANTMSISSPNATTQNGHYYAGTMSQTAEEIPQFQRETAI